MELNIPDLLNPDRDNLTQLLVENFPTLIFRSLELAPNGELVVFHPLTLTLAPAGPAMRAGSNMSRVGRVEVKKNRDRLVVFDLPTLTLAPARAGDEGRIARRSSESEKVA